LNRYVVVHGHFYQPPRENPWLEEIELQDSAYPYHDWNERITAECYGTNARSRLLDDEGRIYRIINNYARMSYNVGPTLLKWLADKEPEVYAAVVEADRESMKRFGGHGSAMAQAYNHMILPLANARDKYTQVLWGIRDFETRFGRKPEGMWLPETAVDLESLDMMAQLGIRFTMLAPHQAKRVRAGRTWTEVEGDGIDPTRAYYVKLPSGRRMTVFFYDGPISRSVAFEGILSSGSAFRDRLLGGFAEGRDWAQIVHIATDGESYGHHHRFGDMALGFALEHIEQDGKAKLTNYAQYLALHPAETEAEIREDTSWSCAHGVERWRGNCGCNTGANPDWDQEWRAPLRESLDWLRDEVAGQYELRAREFFHDPWEARNEYIDVILAREEEPVRRFFERHAATGLTEEQQTAALELLELQRHALLMFTSCGWFFDDLSGIETTQVLQYAARVIQLAHKVFGDHLEERFLARLVKARSNKPENGDGRMVWDKFVRPAIVGLPEVAAHFAVSSLFEDYGSQVKIFAYTADIVDYQRKRSGSAQLAVGHVRLRSVITGEPDELSFGVVHFGDHNITAGVRKFRGDTAFAEMAAEASDAFDRADLPDTIRILDRHFGELTYSLRSLFKDEQRKVLDTILSGSVGEAETAMRNVFEHHASLMRFLIDIGSPMPPEFQSAAELVITARLRRALTSEPIDLESVRSSLEDAKVWGIELDTTGMAFTTEQTLERLARGMEAAPDDLEALQLLESSSAALDELPFQVDLVDVQNRFWHVLQAHYPAIRRRVNDGDPAAQAWTEVFHSLAAHLSVRVE
jgi:alpha-amylase/alpha-mannosidase (GH57 family)